MQKSELEFDNKLKVFEKKSHLEVIMYTLFYY